MKFKRITKKDDFAFPGLKIEREYVDSTLTKISFRDEASDRSFAVQKDGWSDFCIIVPEPPETKEVFEVNGALDGVAIAPQVFDREDEAQHFLTRKSIDGEVLKKTIVLPS